MDLVTFAKLYFSRVLHVFNLWKSAKLWKTLWKVWKTFKIKGN